MESKFLSFGVETFILEKVKKKFFNMFRCYEHVFIYFAKQSFKNVIRRCRHKMKNEKKTSRMIDAVTLSMQPKI